MANFPIQVEQSTEREACLRATEIVERKGLGHPDTICDLVAERVAHTLARSYVEHFDRILHFNCDKALLVAGTATHKLGGGRLESPMKLILGDRASFNWGGVPIDIAGLAEAAAREWFRENMRFVDVFRHLKVDVEMKQGSESLTQLFHDRTQTVLGANDTSATVGFAPLSETERLVLLTEKTLNSADFKSLFPETGEDVKVMGVRLDSTLHLTVAMPLVDRYVESEAWYFRRKKEIAEWLRSSLTPCLEKIRTLEIYFNNLDRQGRGLDGMYLTVIGTSAEGGDSGQVGRGNSVNGLICLHRPGGAEAASGKNPVSHVGKIYNVLAHRLAEKIHREVAGLREVYVWMCSRIGDPVNQPQLVEVEVKLQSETTLQDVDRLIRDIVEREFADLPRLCNELLGLQLSVA